MDDPTSESALRSGAQAGDPAAQLALAQLLWNKEVVGEQAEAMHWFEAAANLGGAVYQRIFGALLCWEQGPFQDFSRGFNLLLHAAKLGEGTAQYLVAAELAVGDNVARDPVAAAGWYAKAAEGGNAEAAYNLATMYLTGDGVPMDKTRAIALLEAAAEKGEILALRALGEGYEHGANGLPIDPVRAAMWMDRYAKARVRRET